MDADVTKAKSKNLEERVDHTYDVILFDKEQLGMQNRHMLLRKKKTKLSKINKGESSEQQDSFFLRCILCATGGMLMGVATVLFIAGGYGADPMSTLLEGMSHTLHISVDTCNNLLSLTFVLVAFCIDKKQIHVGTVVFPIVTTITMRILTPLVQAETLFQRALFCIVGIGMIATSIALSIRADCGKNPYDCVTFGLMKKIALPYHVVRWILDGIMLVSGIAMQGTFGVVTIINLFVLGKLVTAALTLLESRKIT